MKIYKLSAFPKDGLGGNKAAVVLDANHLTHEQKQAIARQIGYSETAFVFPKSNTTFSMQYYTPNCEIDLCGHATIASFSLMRQIGKIKDGNYTIQTKAGMLKVYVNEKTVFMKQKLPKFLGALQESDLTGCFDQASFIHQDYPIQIVSTGLKEIFVPVKDVETLNKLQPNYDVIKQVSEQFDVIGMHLFAFGDDADAYGRNFAPLVGINEESATGTSNGALSCYLFKHYKKKEYYDLRQGYSMGLPSQILVKLRYDSDKITDVQVGGTAITFEE